MRLDWNPVLPITAIFFGLLSVLLEPEGDEPLNQGIRVIVLLDFLSFLDAGNMILKDRSEYNKIARFCAMGGEHEGIKYDNLMKINT